MATRAKPLRMEMAHPGSAARGQRQPTQSEAGYLNHHQSLKTRRRKPLRDLRGMPQIQRKPSLPSARYRPAFRDDPATRS